MISFHSFDIKEERTWIPTPKQFRVGPNPNYLNSLSCGIFSPILHLPQILWFNCLYPFLKNIFLTFSFLGIAILAGVMGRANGFRVVSMTPRVPTEDEKREAMNEMLRGSGFVATSLQGDSQGKDEGAPKA